MALEPQGAALMVPSELPLLTDCMGTTGWLGRKGARWAFLLDQDGRHRGAHYTHYLLGVCLVQTLGAWSDLHSNGSHAGSTSTVGDAEGLVQVKMRHVRAVVCWPAQSHLGVRREEIPNMVQQI